MSYLWFVTIEAGKSNHHANTEQSYIHTQSTLYHIQSYILQFILPKKRTKALPQQCDKKLPSKFRLVNNGFSRNQETSLQKHGIISKHMMILIVSIRKAKWLAHYYPTPSQRWEKTSILQ
ncbi:hypothetical protein EUGRSUZ_K00888 [Eucalyptus grandis]|uniref:Uncharacterized protein n=2 Tax=Eucalyptus grandis TaxID=71139 RepID=A0ACC3IRW9_EUCGR|nr:hypothetical protein EUGRSUZ_K00888 [Eucalyptus grandis]